MAVQVNQCQTCIFWERKRKGQYLGMCLNPLNYQILREFNDGCTRYEETKIDTFVQMQSNTRG